MDAIFDRIHAFPLQPQIRTRPLQVICVGPSRSGTDSLRQALLQIGYPNVFHGYDTLLDSNRYQKPMVSRLLEKKYRSKDGTAAFTAQEFDQLFGKYDAITDMPVAILARELIEAYPDAKVILNRRKDVDAWYTSTLATFIAHEESWLNWILSWFSADLYWTRRLIFGQMFPYFYHGSFQSNGKWVYQEHCAMVRGLGLSKERFLEWGVEDGWDPLCEFLGKEVPKSEFPMGNTGKDFQKTVKEGHAMHRRVAWQNMAVMGTVVLGIGSAVLWRTALRAL